MKAKVICKVHDKGTHSFYLNTTGGQYYLFQQDFRRGVNEYYQNGVSLDEAMCFSHSHNDSALIRTMQKLPLYIKYIEKEYGITVLKQTAKKNARCGRKQVAA